MGARQSRRSVDITTTPKKDGLPAESGVEDAAAPGDGKLERIEETDTKPTTNGIAPHTDVLEDKDKDKDDATEKDKQEEAKSEEAAAAAKVESAGESPTDTSCCGEVTTPTEANTPASPNTATSPDTKETKKKEKMKKKWSFRSISFSKKDKNKPAREEAPKNGDVTKEEPLAEGGEEAETGSATAGSPVEDKSTVSSPTAENEAAPATPAAATTTTTETKEDSSAVSAASSPAVAAEEKTEEPAVAAAPSAPTPAAAVTATAAAAVVPPVEAAEKKEEEKKEEEQEEAEKKVVEVSPAAGGQLAPDHPVEVTVFRVQTVATTMQPSIIERKTSEDIPSLPTPSSPPPTPLDSSPSQQAQQAATIAEVPAEAVRDEIIAPPFQTPERNEQTLDTTTSFTQRPTISSSVDEPRTIPASVQAPLPVLDSPKSSPPVANNLASLSAGDSNNDASVKESETPSEVEQQQQQQQQQQEHVTEIAPIVEKSDLDKYCEVKVDEKMLGTLDVKIEGDAQSIEKEKEVVGCLVREQQPIESEEKLSELVNKEEDSVEQAIEQERLAEEVVVLSSEDVTTVDAIVESEEGPMPLSEEEILVEAKPAVVIPVDEEVIETIDEDVAEIEKDASKIDTSSLEVNLDEKVEETETVSDSGVYRKETDSCNDIIVGQPIDYEFMPPPLPESPVPNSEEKFVSENLVDLKTVPSLDVDVEPRILDPVTNSDGSSPASQRIEATSERSIVDDVSVPRMEQPTAVVYLASETQTLSEMPLTNEFSHCSLDSAQLVNSHDYSPIPLGDIASPFDRLSDSIYELPDEDHTLRNHPTETLPPTPPRSPSPRSCSRSNLSIASGLTTSTKDSSQTQLYDDQSNREFKMESISISLNSYNESDIELKERLAESLAEALQKDYSVSCQLSNNATSSTTVQETTHQSTLEPEAPLENNVANESTTESPAETVKITTPAVPSDVPATPPSAPAITEDVASVAKAIEEIDISDKAVAAATIECNTNEIIADARYQNDINE